MEEKYSLTPEDVSYKDNAELFRRYADGDANAYLQLLEVNQSLVMKVVSKYSAGDPDMEQDLFQEGRIGLMKAIKEFDHKRGVQFSTFATNVIRNEIRNALPKYMKTLSVTKHDRKIIGMVNRASREIESSTGKDASPEAIAAETGLSLSKVIEIMQLKELVSLDATIGEDDTTRGELIADSRAETPETAVETNGLYATLLDSIGTLDRLERIIFMHRPLEKLNKAQKNTLAKKMNITAERLEQLDQRIDYKLSVRRLDFLNRN